MSTHAENAIAALDEIEIDETDVNSRFDLMQKRMTTAKVHAALAQAEAVEKHTQVIAAFMASTMTAAQAKTLVKALVGMGGESE